MKAGAVGRLLFGASAVLFSIVALMWHDPQTWQELAKIWSVPFGVTIGAILMGAQIAGGIGILFSPTVRAASMILIIVYAVFSLACIPAIVAHPVVYQGYGSFFELFAPLCGAVAVYAVSGSRAVRSSGLRRFARIGMGLSAVSFALEQAFYLKATASFVPKWIPPNQMFWAVLTTVAFALAALALLVNRQARLATLLMTLMLVVFGLAIWVPVLVAHPQSHFSWSEFALTFLIAGAAWVVAETLLTTRSSPRFRV